MASCLLLRLQTRESGFFVARMSYKSTRYDNRAGATARGYGYKWQQTRKIFLRAHPLCECPHCQAGKIRITPSEVVDHIIPHEGDMKLFWDRNNWQALSKQCHDSYKQKLEKTGKVAGCDASGVPLDGNHHWNN